MRPGKWPEAVWAVGGALVLLLFGLVSISTALQAVVEGWDVYLFLTGMMLLSELARREGLFDTLAGWAVRHAAGSARRLFALVYGIGIVVTVFMSNDATAVVLTPAVYVVAKKAGARPLPYLFACAFIANAASFVLPISNPANLVVFGDHMPPLLAWLRSFALPSIASIVVTWGALALLFRGELAEPVESETRVPRLSGSGRLAALGIVGVVLAMLAASALGFPARRADADRRSGRHRHGAGEQARGAVALAGARLLERAAARRGAVRAGGRCRADGPGRGAHRSAARRPRTRRRARPRGARVRSWPSPRT